MPPARTIIRRSHYTSINVADLDTTHNRDLQKPYVNTTQHKIHNNNGSKNVSKNLNNEKRQNYMDLNEFLQKSVDSSNESSADSCSTKENDNDYPKPSVDLLASLITLAKMIQNQKQLIQNQRLSEPSLANDNTPSIVMISTPSESDVMSSKDQINTNEGSNTTTNDNLIIQQYDDKDALSKRPLIPEEIKDFDYWDRRKRNNLAAKKSREERRKKELEIVEMTKQLETENSQLTLMLKRLTARNEWLEFCVQDIQKRCQDNLVESSSLSSEES